MLSTRTHAGIVQYTLRPEPSRFRLLFNHFGLVLLLAWNYSLRLEGRTAVIGAALLLLWIWIISKSLVSGLSFPISSKPRLRRQQRACWSYKVSVCKSQLHEVFYSLLVMLGH